VLVGAIASYHASVQEMPTMPPFALAHAVNAAWILDAAFVALVIPAGFALLTCGLVRKKNAGHLVMLNLAAYVFTVLAYYAVGHAFEYGALAANADLTSAGVPPIGHFLIGSGHWGFVGGTGFFLSAPAADPAGHVLAMFHVVFALVAAGILVGAVCERITFWAFVLCELFVGGILYPIFACWVWGGGWLSQTGATLGFGHG
jgi:Amt family ammonium transporter